MSNAFHFLLVCYVASDMITSREVVIDKATWLKISANNFPCDGQIGFGAEILSAYAARYLKLTQ